MNAANQKTTTQPVAAWSAVVALSLCASTLIASEFMPVVCSRRLRPAFT